MGDNVNQPTGRGVGPTGAGRGTDTGTALDGAGAVDAVERDPAGAGGGDAAPPETSRLEPRRLGCESTASGSALTTIRGGATSDETSWISQVTDGGMAKEAEPPKKGN
jgi:hypothetical protein